MFVCYWLLFGLVHLILTITVESHLSKNNPEPLLEFEKRLQSKKKLPTYSSMLMFVVFWPFMLYHTIRASLRNMSLIEYFIWEQEERKKNALDKPDGIMWVDREGSGFKFSILLQQYPKEEISVYRVTHLILRTENNPVIRGWRMPFSDFDQNKITEFFTQECNAPDLFMGDYDQAKSFCEKDSFWRGICSPGREKERAFYWMNLKDSSR